MNVIKEETRVLTEVDSRELLRKYNVNLNKYKFIKTNEADKEFGNLKQLTYPLVMKVVSEKIVHKSDFGGVQLNLKNQKDIKRAFEKILTNAKRHDVQEKEIEGVLVQDMVSGVQEILIGVKRDPIFGAVIIIGFGGVLVEMLKDVALGICPLSENDVYKMLKKLKGYPLLEGYRGKPASDISAIVQMVLTVQEMVTKEKNIIEMDLNPVIIKEDGKGCIAVDARIVIKE